MKLNLMPYSDPNQGISCADVADICVKALHDSTARNKSFDVSEKPMVVCMRSRMFHKVSYIKY